MRIFIIILATFCYVVKARQAFLNDTKPTHYAKGVADTAAKGAGTKGKTVAGENFNSSVERDGQEFLRNNNYSSEQLLIPKNSSIENTNTIADFAKKTIKRETTSRPKSNLLEGLTFEQFNKLYNGLKGDLINEHTSKARPYKSTEKKPIPDNFDWREQGAVTPIKHQQGCASCWAFSAAAALESHRFIKTGKLEDVSVQNLLDCSKGRNYGGNNGCQGGLVETAFDYVEDYGVSSEALYPYDAKDGSCRYKQRDIAVNCTGYVRIPKGDEKALEHALVTKGPISAAIHVILNLLFYAAGVFYDEECGNNEHDLNHAVLIVGYGVEPSGLKYWLVKNSYGPDWGMDGYVKMAKDAGNHCGIATYARYPVV